MASPQALVDQTCWYPDSGASHHITSDLANLNLKAEEYTGSDQLRVGNGTGLSIHHIGNAQLSTPTLPFTLYNVLHVPHITNICCLSISSPKPLTLTLNFTLFISW